MKRNPPVELVCLNCGNTFKRRFSYHKYIVNTRGITNTYCSKECKNLHQSYNLPDTIADEYASGLSCAEIGEKHNVNWGTVRKKLIKLGVKFRSKSEHLSGDKNPTKGKGHSLETRKKLSEMTRSRFSDPSERRKASEKQIEALATGKFPSVSKIEDTVAMQLNNLAIGYTRQHLVRDPETGKFVACVDFMLDTGTVVEVNGTYWHSDPRNYPNGAVSQSQKRTQERYNRKLEALKRLNIPVVEIWEIDIRKDAYSAVCNALR